MFRSFFLNRHWLIWSLAGGVLILLGTWYQVQLDVRLNSWFGNFFDLIQTALAEPNSISLDTYLDHCLIFAKIAGTYIALVVILEFFIRHYVFRWRMAMNDYYTANWTRLRLIEGAAQRVQEDTMRFARIMEGLGVSLMRSVMTLIAFLPLLWTLSESVTELPFIGTVEHSLVYLALVFSAGGTVMLAIVGIKLPGLEFDIQKVEAAYRKELVFGEEYEDRADPPTVRELFGKVRMTYFFYFFHYLYFDVAKWSYLQFGVILPFIALGPTVLTGAITFGILQRILHAHDRVERSFQYLVHSWSTIVELISVYKRLKSFESVLSGGESPRAAQGASA